MEVDESLHNKEIDTKTIRAIIIITITIIIRINGTKIKSERLKTLSKINHKVKGNQKVLLTNRLKKLWDWILSKNKFFYNRIRCRITLLNPVFFFTSPFATNVEMALITQAYKFIYFFKYLLRLTSSSLFFKQPFLRCSRKTRLLLYAENLENR